MLETLSRLWRQALAEAGNVPTWQFFAAICLLPLFGLPVSPLLIAVGIRAGPVSGSLLAIAGLGVNITLAYRISRGWLRKSLTAWLLRRGYNLPQTSHENEAKLILMTRLVPGLPLAVQNYILGLAGVRFWPYLVFSLPVQGLYAIGFVVLGGSLVDSNAWKFATAAGLLVAASLAVSLVRRGLNRRTADLKTQAAELEPPP